ncbi:response regulator transcription factor [Streptomyces sp. HNM0574]|nr:response regulator transcription factor [Streptomyces sp. HNM0574]NLU68670.1 response regulator transcription factor [Streptomyces sp. HNM0574]
MVVDDEALVRSGFELILNAADGIEVVATAAGSEAVPAVRRTGPDVVLLDIRMPDVDGLSVLREIRTLPEPPAVAMLTTFDTDEYILAALRSGAAGFLLKDTEPEQLAQLVRTLAAGGVVMSPKASLAILHSHPAGDPDEDVPGPPSTAPEDGAVRDAAGHPGTARVGTLTGRERDVLVLVAEGLSNVGIGARLHLSAGTVKDHVSAILAKLGVGSRVQAALLAQRAGLLSGTPGSAPDGTPRDHGDRR